jgi:hypothetical protein
MSKPAIARVRLLLLVSATSRRKQMQVRFAFQDTAERAQHEHTKIMRNVSEVRTVL